MSADKLLSPGECRFRSAYGVRVSVPFVSDGPSMTKQSFKDECDINVIMRRYERTGVLPTPVGVAPQYADCSAVDFQEAMLQVADAKSLFNQLPARVRERFSNDPARMLEFCEDARNAEEARKLGLLKPEEVPATPIPVSVVGAPVAAPGESSTPVQGSLDVSVSRVAK